MPHILCPGEPLRPARPDRAIALGAALLVIDLPGLSPEFDLAAVAEANRWASIAVVKPTQLETVKVWRRHPSLRDLVVIDGPEEKWESELRRELSETGPPERREVVTYINAAVQDPTFHRALQAELLGDSSPKRSARHAAFASRGPLTATGWMGLYTVARSLSLPRRLTLGDAATRLGVDRRTLQTHCREELDLGWHAARKGFGWKWAVERALRLHGYVADTPAVPLGVRTT